jgi:hypothetical protein
MVAGAAYDFAFATAILGFRVPAARLLGLTLPEDPTYLQLNGILLLLLGAIYLVAGADPHRHQNLIAVVAAGRFLGFVFLFAVWVSGRPPAFFGLALGDLFFALLHVVLLLRARREPR